jgi:thiosulfate/3-mercaptopyruvate sulfurtransferase
MKGAITIPEYVHPEVLVTTQWVVDHAKDPNVRVIESDEDVLLYEVGHVPGSVKVDWHTDLQDPLRRDFIDKAGFEKLMSSIGVSNNTTVIFYGDRNNWYACYSLWLFKLYGHQDTRIMNGGRTKWIEENRELSKDVPKFAATTYTAKEADATIRAFRDQVMAHIKQPGKALIDVRSPAEYSGEVLHMAGYPQEGAQRGGHVPGAASIPWSQAANADGTFKSTEELTSLYGGKGITPDKDVIAYCRIGERSSHTWFVLTYLLGYGNVRNYDGSWTEWGSMVNVPIER